MTTIEYRPESAFSDDERKLYELMSDISEDCWCAGWMHGNEFALWDAITTGDLNYGMGEIDRVDLAQVAALAVGCGRWIIWRDDDDGLDKNDASEWGAYSISLKDWFERCDGRATSPAPGRRPDDVPIPLSADMAQLMANLGLGYLQQHAPERLKPAPSTAELSMEPEARMLRAGRNLFDVAKRNGWKDDGEGAYEFVTRTIYAQGREDASAPSTASEDIHALNISAEHAQKSAENVHIVSEEGLPPLPNWWASLESRDKHFAHQLKNNMQDYARAALAAKAQDDQTALALRYFMGSAYVVDTTIHRRGYNWSEAYLDQARAFALSIAKAQPLVVPPVPQQDQANVIPPFAEPASIEPLPSPMYFKALSIVHEAGYASVAMVQRKLRIGWNDAENMLRLMWNRGDVTCEMVKYVRGLRLLPETAEQSNTAGAAKGGITYQANAGPEPRNDGIDNYYINTKSSSAAPVDVDAERKLYNELIYAVGRKFPGETRHATALRYIHQAETPKHTDAATQRTEPVTTCNATKE